jgi:tRNA-(ms[2]io[6]A)-hydroxylase
MAKACFALYWLLCEERYGREVTVARLQELAAVETQALTGFLSNPEDVRMHSCGVELGI